MLRCLLPGLSWIAVTAHAETPGEVLDRDEEMARPENPLFSGLALKRVEKVFCEKGVVRGVGYVSCGSCRLVDAKEKIV